MEEIISNQFGVKIGEIRQEGDRIVAYDKIGQKIGYTKDGCTYNAQGKKILSSEAIGILFKKM